MCLVLDERLVVSYLLLMLNDLHFSLIDRQGSPQGIVEGGTGRGRQATPEPHSGTLDANSGGAADSVARSETDVPF